LVLFSVIQTMHVAYRMSSDGMTLTSVGAGKAATLRYKSVAGTNIQ